MTTTTGGAEMAATEAATETTQPQTPSVHSPVHGASYAFEHDGPNLWVYTWLEPGGALPEHFHPSLDEYWEALEGTARVKLAGSWRDLRPEDGPIHVARNARHELRNEAGETLRLRCEARPAGRLEEFLTETARAAQEGLYNSRNLPTSFRGLVWAAEVAQRYRDETVMASPPPALQRAVMPLIARLAR